MPKMKPLAPPPELVAAFETRSAPFARDVVMVRDVRRWFGEALHLYPSDIRITYWLTSPPFEGRAIQFRAGPAIHRGIVLRDHARYAMSSGRAIMDHINGNEPLTDPLLA